MKSNLLKSIFISLILVMGVSNAWAYNVPSGYYVYFEKPDNWSQASLLLGHSSYSKGYSMTKISNTKLYYWKTDKWDGYTEYFFMQDKWGEEYSSPTNRNAYAGSNKTSVFKTEFKNYHLFTTAGSKLTSTSSYTVVNKVQTIKVQIKNGANWEDAPVVPADLTASTYALTSATAAGAKSASLVKESTTVSATVDAAYSATVSLSCTNILDGYTFEGWYDANDNKITSYTVSNAHTIYARFTKNATYSLTVEAGEGIASVTGSTDPVTLNSTYSITATPETGYTFSTWTANPAANASFGSATTANTTVTVKNGSVTVTATATEIMSTLTTSNSYTEGNPGYAAPTASVKSIGYETTATVRATAADNGYTFTGWTLTNCTRTDGGAADATSITVRSNGDGKAATVIANFEEIPPTTVYFKPINGWKGDNTRFAVYYWEGNTNGWIDMIEDGCTGEFYKADIPAGFTNIKFVSFPTDKENNWDYDINRTEDLKVPNDGKVLYDMASTNITTLYLNPGVWNVDGAWFPAYFFSDGEAWKKMTDENRDNIYACEIPENKKKVIFVRKNPSNQDLNFNDKWAQTGDLTIPTDGKNMFSISGWDNNGSWDKVWDNSCWTTYEPSNTYTISFDRQGATTGSESVTATFGEKPATIDIPERTGYTFGGYYTEANGEGTQIIDAEGKWINGTNYVDADGNWISTDCNITFYAQWTEKLSTITIIVSEGGSVKVDGEDFESGNTVQVGVATSKTITLHPNAGYGIDAFGVNGDAWIAGNGTYTLTAKGSGSTGTLYANFVASEYTITWNPNGGKVDPTTSSYTYNGTTVELPTPTRDGFTFVGWFTEQSGGTQITEIGTTNKPTSDVTYYAHWQGAAYSVGLNQEGAATSGTEKVTAYYEGDMPTAGVTMPTAQNGYAFMGYWDKKDGQGTQYYNADGTSAHVWDKTENNVTLYAYFKMAEITTITLNENTFEPVDANGIGFVTATPTIEPKPTGTTRICWRLLYYNGTPVEGHNASTEGCEQNQVKFSIAGLSSGNYKIEAVLRTGDNCESGTELSTKTVNFTIASTYTITVKYTCDGKEIMAPTKIPAHVTEETEITAPTIPGYTFSKWVAGDGVTITDAQNGENTNKIIKFTAIYDGYLTAQYTTRPMVYFKNTLGWKKVYVYTFNNQVWHNGDDGIGGNNDDKGVQPNSNRKEFGEMTLVEGTDDIYFFELNPTSNYTQDNNSNENYIAFSDQDMSTYNFFYGTNAVYRGDHKESLTLFIPHTEQQQVTRNNTKYYNKGIWMKYNSTESGYQLAGTVPNDDPEHDGWSTYGNKFTAQQPGGYTFSITKNLDANKTYEFKIKNSVYVTDWEGNAKNQWFATKSQINTNACTSLPLDHEESAATRYDNIKITTNAAGEYKFTIDLSTGKVILSVEYPVAVGDYRVIYTDNATWSQGTAHDANWYHPSRIIKKNKTAEPTKDIISFFISFGKNTTMRFQKVQSITNGNVTWEDAGEARIPDNIKEAGVYNFIVTQTANGESISMEDNAEPYTGNYYIRCDAVGGKWDNYKTHSENRMTYSAFSESKANSFGEKFSHYATKYCTNGTKIEFTIANDYSPCISDTLAQDITNPLDNLDSEGRLLNNDIYSANVRFMWNHKTNKISRAYVGPAADKQSQFLMLRTKDEIQGAAGELDPDEGDILDEENNIYAARFADTQNWMYERTIKVKPGTRVKLYASYPKIYHIYIDNQTGWNDIALYAWKDSGDKPLGDWPGIQPSGTVVIEGKTYHDFQVNEWVFNGKLKLNNNNNGKETNEYAIGSAGNYYLTAENYQLSLKENGYKAHVIEATAQYFRGAYDNNNATWDDNNSIVILGGSGTDWNTIRVIYDFKTNRLMAALVPDQEVSEEKIIAADVMIIRKHQENATCITLTNDNSKLTEVKTVYGSLQFNRWVLNNRDSEKSGIEFCTKKIDNQDTYDEEVTNEHHPILSPQVQKTIYERALYFISFPFDVHLSDVFGFGTYGTHWVISTYNGQRRAQNGYFVDNCMNEDCTNWDYIWDPSDFTMKANQGYLLSLDLDLMKYNNTDFWLHNIDQVELFFPSTADLETIEKTNYQMPSLSKKDYECTINFNKANPREDGYNPANDHRVRDSYWRCIGVPSFANYDGSLYKTEQDAENEENPINWKDKYTWQADNAAFPFLYEWKVQDNSLQVQNTSNFNFRATFAYLVQNGNSIYWSAVNAKPSNIVARRQVASEINNYDWKITIARNGEVEDQTFVRLTDHEKVTTEFDFNQDLSKEFNYGRSDIYTLIGYEKAAANSLPLSEQTTVIPLGLSIEYNGDYTLAMPDRVNGIGVTLIDSETGTRTNLSAGMVYTLTLKKGDYNNRFYIEISPVKQVPTDIEYVTGDTNSKDTVRKVLIDNILYIIKDNEMFDARGARVK